MLDIFGRDLHVGDLIMVAYGSSPEICIITHKSKAGNFMCNLYADARTPGGKFAHGRFTITLNKYVVLIPSHAVPPILMDEYQRIISDPKKAIG